MIFLKKITNHTIKPKKKEKIKWLSVATNMYRL